MSNKKDLEDKIKQLEEKLGKLSRDIGKTDEERATFVIASSPIGHNKLDTVRRVSDAKKKSQQKAGLLRLSDDGSVWEEDEPTDIRIPHESIHTFDNLEFCECECHERDKKDCMHCYDHPQHLEDKREMRKPPDTTVSETVTTKPTKSRLKRLLDW